MLDLFRFILIVVYPVTKKIEVEPALKTEKELIEEWKKIVRKAEGRAEGGSKAKINLTSES